MREAILARLAKGSASFSELRWAIDGEFRKLDRTLQAMKRRGEVVLLPRQRGVRSLPEWSLPNGVTDTRL
jgi:hypothetical protein